MQSLKSNVLAKFPACVFLATLAIAGGVFVMPTVAQERRSEREDDDRSDSSERRRGWGSWRRDRDERRDDRDDDNDREGPANRESSDAASDDANFTAENWAKGLVKKHDKNGNSMLDGEEREAAGRQASQADANKDNVITIDELIAQAGGKSTPATSTATAAAKSADSSSKAPPAVIEKTTGSGAVKNPKSAVSSKRVFTWTGNSGSSSAEKKPERRTYRFTPARERLPNELPAWFKSQDKNGDGQVAMSEYSRSWTKSTVAKFQGYDTDGNGVVTAKEAAGKK